MTGLSEIRPRLFTQAPLDGVTCEPFHLLAKTPREVSGTQDITGGLPRVTEIFEARTPRDPAKMAEVAGIVRLGEKKRGKRTIYVQPIDDSGKPIGEEVEHQVPPGKHLRVHTGDRVKGLVKASAQLDVVME